MKFDNLIKALTNYGNDSVTIMQSHLNDTNLQGEIKFKNATESFVTLTMPEYGLYTDSGRKAGKRPSVEVLKPWAQRKNIPFSALFAIAKSIGDNGTEGKDFLKYFFEDDERLMTAINDAICDDIVIDILLQFDN